MPNIIVVDQNGYPVTWMGPGYMHAAKTYATIDPRSGEPVIVVVLDPTQPMETIPFAVQQAFQQ